MLHSPFTALSRISSRQPVQLILYLLISLCIGIVITLVLDSFDNIAVEKKIRRDLRQQIEGAAASFQDCAGSVKLDGVLLFLKEFTDSTLKGKVLAVKPGAENHPDAEEHSFLFTYGEGEKRIDFFIVTSFLNEELAILDTPELIFGLFAAVIAFTVIVLYAEKRKQALMLQQEYETKHAEYKKVIEENEALSLLGRMVATLAHEIKTPIATISNLIQILPARLGDEKFTKRFIEMTREELNRTHQLINNLLAYGKEIEASKEEWVPFIPFIHELGLKNRVLPEVTGSMEIYGDRFYLELLFENLFRNSRAAGADKIQVRICDSQSEEDSQVRILFEDNGRGFPPGTDLQTLINPFVTSNSNGAGLGLYLMNKIISAHEGQISLYQPKRGAGVMVSFPRQRIVIYEQG